MTTCNECFDGWAVSTIERGLQFKRCTCCQQLTDDEEAAERGMKFFQRAFAVAVQHGPYIIEAAPDLLGSCKKVADWWAACYSTPVVRNESAT